MGRLGDYIGGTNTQLNTALDDLTGTGENVSLVDQISGNITPEARTVVFSENDLNGTTLFWDDDLQGSWSNDAGTNGNSWSGDADMDGYTSKTWVRVLNYNNTFEDEFHTNTFVDTTNSTGTGDYSTDYDYILDDQEILQSRLIAANQTSYSRATLTVEGSGLSDDTFEMTANGGSNWESVTNGTEHTFTNSSTGGIKYRVTNTGSGGGGFPTAFGTWGSAISVQSKVTSVSVKYS